MLRVEGLWVKRGAFALQDVDLEVPQGEYFCLLGPTGSGKTMLVECIAGLNRLEQGRIFLAGQEVTHVRPELRQVSYVPQDYTLFPHMTVAGNIAAPCRVRKLAVLATEARVKELADLLHITHLVRRYPENLSGGEKQRVALARALAVMPRLLLLDEPFGALDQETRLRLWPEMKELHQRIKLTIIHVTHDFEEAALMATRLGVMEAGRLVQAGTVEEVFYRPATSSIAQFVGAENILTAHAEPTSDGRSLLEVAPGLRLAAEGVHRGEVSVAIRPDEITLAAEGEGEGPNRLGGKLLAVIPLRSVVRVVLDIGLPMVASISRGAWKGTALEVGQSVNLVIPPAAVHVLPQD